MLNISYHEPQNLLQKIKKLSPLNSIDVCLRDCKRNYKRISTHRWKNRYLINNVEEIVVFLGLKLF